MISSNFLPLFGGHKNAYSSQMALFGQASPSAAPANTPALALAERIGQSNMLTKSDKSGLMRLMATVEQFGQSNKEALMAKVSAIAGMTEMLNSNKGTQIEAFSAAESIKLYWKYQGNLANEAVQVAPETQIASMIAHLQSQLEER